jgi:hypothetical protein
MLPIITGLTAFISILAAASYSVWFASSRDEAVKKELQTQIDDLKRELEEVKMYNTQEHPKST